MQDVTTFQQYLRYLTEWRIVPEDAWGNEVILQQHKLLVRQLAVMAAVSFMISGGVAVTLAMSQSVLWGGIWFMLVLPWSLMVGLGWLSLRNKPEPKKVSGKYLFKAEMSAIYYGFAWGALAYVFDLSNPLYILLITVVTSSMMAGALALMPNHPRIVFRYALCAFGPILTCAAFSGHQIGLLVAFGTPSLIFAMMYGGKTSLYHLQQLVSARLTADASRKLIFSVVETIEDPFALIATNGTTLVSNDAFDALSAKNGTAFINNEEVRVEDNWYLTRVTEDSGLGKAITLRNVSALKQRQTELEHAIQDAEAADAAKSRFLSAMSHQLRTPLNVIIGFSSLMGTDSKIPMSVDSIKSNCDDIHASGKTLLDVIDNIFAYTSLDASYALDSGQDAYCVQDAVKLELKNIGQKYAHKSLGLKIVRHDPIYIHTVPQNMLRRALFNLLDNAARHSATSADIRVQVKQSKDEVSISVRDNGPGMTRTTLARARDPFWQPDNVLNLHKQGPGLGLSFVHKMAETFGGTLTLKSQEGAGTLATLSLPTQASLSDSFITRTAS